MRWDRTYGQLVFVKRMTVKLKFKGRAKDESPTEHRQERVARLRVQEKGLYGVAFEEIFDGPSPFDTTSLSLTRLGEPVAFHVEPDPTIFGRGSTLYFLSEGGELNPYEQEAVYEIGVAAGEGHPMERLSRPPSGQAVDFYWERLEKEENYYYQSTLLDAPDPWLWEYLFAPQSKIFDLEVDALAPMPESSIMIWDQDGNYIDQWTQFGRPSGVYIDHTDTIYVADSESWGPDNPGWKKGIRIGSAMTGQVHYFIEDIESRDMAHSGAEGVGVDALGNVYGGVVRRQMLERHEPQTAQPTRGATWPETRN